jgi:hypothetical protein
MKKLLLGLLALGLTTQFYAQVIEDGMLPEVEVRATNYKYLNSVDNSEAAVPVQLLEKKAAQFDIKSAEFYEDGSDFYRVYFYIPDGTLVAAYDRDGEILYTIEKFENVALPNSVTDAIGEKFPGWKISKDVYRVSYTKEKGALKRYKVVLDNGVKKIRVKVDEKGVFL